MDSARAGSCGLQIEFHLYDLSRPSVMDIFRRSALGAVGVPVFHRGHLHPAARVPGCAVRPRVFVEERLVRRCRRDGRRSQDRSWEDISGLQPSGYTVGSIPGALPRAGMGCAFGAKCKLPRGWYLAHPLRKAASGKLPRAGMGCALVRGKGCETRGEGGFPG